MTDLSQLNGRFGHPGVVEFIEGPGGLTLVSIHGAASEARIALRGAHLLDWTPLGQQPVIWLSERARFSAGTAIRGGVPVCWPWFGPHPSDASLPAHGVARTGRWEILGIDASDHGNIRIRLRLVRDDAAHERWPHNTPVEIRFTIGQALSIELTTHNLGAAPVVVGQALHTYFQVSDIRRVRVLGLEDRPYLDKLDGGRRHVQAGAVAFSAETDRVYLDSTADCVIEDPGLGRRIRIAKQGSRSTVVWNPWAERSAQTGDFTADGYLTMLCIEAANAADDVVSIAPGAEHTLAVRYTIEPST